MTKSVIFGIITRIKREPIIRTELKPIQRKFVPKLVNSGQYRNEDEAVNAIIKDFEVRFEQLRTDIEKGYEGEPVDIDFDDIKRQGRKRYQNRLQ